MSIINLVNNANFSANRVYDIKLNISVAHSVLKGFFLFNSMLLRYRQPL